MSLWRASRRAGAPASRAARTTDQSVDSNARWDPPMEVSFIPLDYKPPGRGARDVLLQPLDDVPAEGARGGIEGRQPDGPDLQREPDVAERRDHAVARIL